MISNKGNGASSHDGHKTFIDMIYIYYYTGLLSFSYRLQWIDMFMFISCFFFIFMILSCSWNVFGKSDRIGVNSANSLFSCFASKIPVPPVLSAVNYGRVGVSERGNGTSCCSAIVAVVAMQCSCTLRKNNQRGERQILNLSPIKGTARSIWGDIFPKARRLATINKKHTHFGGVIIFRQ